MTSRAALLVATAILLGGIAGFAVVEWLSRLEEPVAVLMGEPKAHPMLVRKASELRCTCRRVLVLERVRAPAVVSRTWAQKVGPEEHCMCLVASCPYVPPRRIVERQAHASRGEAAQRGLQVLEHEVGCALR